MLESTGAAEAKLIIICLGEHEPARELVTLARKHYPHLEIAVAAEDRRAVYEFMDLGVVTMRRKTFDSALAL
ncbi:MAG: potassium transporter, partial [Desulfofustis sp. PB-SRB1]|nr:potassium transporter [Desulfofustis sp. PB-SRB1]